MDDLLSNKHTEELNNDLHLTFERAAIGLAHVSLEGRFIRVNSSLSRFLGYSKQELLALTFQELSLAEDLEESFLWIQSILADEISQDFSKIKRYKHKDGHLVWAKLTTTLIRDEDHTPRFFISSIQDISELKRSESLLRQSEQKLQTIIESVSDEVAIWMTTKNMQETLYVNEGFSKIWQLPRSALRENPAVFFESIHLDDIALVNKAIGRSQHENWDIDYRIQTPDGQIRFIHHAGFEVKGTSPYKVFLAVDRTEIKLRQQQLEQASREDSLTGVLNRSAFNQYLTEALEHFCRYKTNGTLIFIDLDNFKEVNDRYGHLSGDYCLKALAAKLQSSIRRTDKLGRYGGDEFVVLLNNGQLKDATELVCRVGDNIHFTSESGELITVGISYGIHQLDSDIKTVDQWIDQADSLMYEDKATQHN